MKTDVINLLTKPIWQMTGEEFLTLTKQTKDDNQSTQPKYAYGMLALGEALGCSLSTIYSLKRNKILDQAIVSVVGRKIAFDIEKARYLADKYKKDCKSLRGSNKIETENDK